MVIDWKTRAEAAERDLEQTRQLAAQYAEQRDAAEARAESRLNALDRALAQAIEEGERRAVAESNLAAAREEARAEAAAHDAWQRRAEAAERDVLIAKTERNALASAIDEGCGDDPPASVLASRIAKLGATVDVYRGERDAARAALAGLRDAYERHGAAGVSTALTVDVSDLAATVIHEAEERGARWMLEAVDKADFSEYDALDPAEVCREARGRR